MGVLLKMRSIFSPHHFWGTENLNLNLNLNLIVNRNFNFRNFCYYNICLTTSILTWMLTKWLHKPTEKSGVCYRMQHCVPPLVSTLTMCTKLQLVQWPSPSFLVVSCNRNLEIAPDVALEAHLFLISPFLRVRFPYVL